MIRTEEPRAEARWNPVYVPLGFVVLTFLGFLAVVAVPSLVGFVVLPSAGLLDVGLLDLAFRLPRGLAAYSLFPNSLELWFQVSGGVVLMSLMASDGISTRGYAISLVAGALVGGLTFVLTGPTAVLIGPVNAAYGLLGTCCLYALRRWSRLGWTARAYSVLLLCVGGATVASVFWSDEGTRPAEAAAFMVLLALGRFTLAPDWSPSDEEAAAEVEVLDREAR